MKILVCVKVIKGEINPFDSSALECALRLSKDVTVLSMAPQSAADALLPLTRLGANVTLISDCAFAGSDTLATSYILSSVIQKMDYDLILCGRQSIDGDTAQVGPMLSDMLSLPLITGALSVEADSKIICQTREGNEEASFPCLVTVERGYILRFPSIFSRVGEIQTLDNSKIGCDIDKCGLQGSPTRVLATFENELGKRKCKFIEFEELVPLIEKLRLEDESDFPQSSCKSKLRQVWAIGDEVKEKAYEIAESVIVIPKSTPEEIAERAKKEKPSVILWNSDAWGRKNAPIVAAKLKTGLCADCTQLECEGDILYMYRPAHGGSITAKIKCLTLPQMATVRTSIKSSDVIVSGGRGIADKTDRLLQFAESISAEIGASRGLVDMNKAPYENQVGLTGKAVAPKVYVAIGISGAIHHTCAIEGAKYVIAINPDKDARIFEYADYGIVGEF